MTNPLPIYSRKRISHQPNNQIMEESPSPATVKQLKYIHMLGQRNKLKEQMKRKTSREEQTGQREREFDTAFNGANNERVRITGRRSAGASSSRSSSRMKKERTIRSAPFRKPAESPRIPDWAIEKKPIEKKNVKQAFAAFAPEEKSIECSDDSEMEELYLDESFEDDEEDTPDAKEVENLSELEEDEDENEYQFDSFMDSEEEEYVCDIQEEMETFLPSPFLKPIHVHHLPKPCFSPIESPILKLMKSTCTTDVAKLRESLQRIYFNEGDSTMDMMEADGSCVPTGKKKPFEKKRTRKSTIIRNGTNLKSKDSDTTALSIKEAIALENANIKQNSISRKIKVEKVDEINTVTTLEVVEAGDIPFSEDGDKLTGSTSSDTYIELLGAVQNLSREKQNKLASLLSTFADGSKEVDNLQDADPKLWKLLSKELQTLELPDEKISKEEKDFEVERRETHRLEERKRKNELEEEKLQAAEERREMRLKELEEEEQEHIRRKKRKEADAKTVKEANAKKKHVKSKKKLTVQTQLLDVINTKEVSTVQCSLKLLTTWSKNARRFGLGKIELLDENEVALEVLDVWLMEEGFLNSKRVPTNIKMAQKLQTLFHSSATTGSESWTGRMAEEGSVLEICFTCNVCPSTIRITHHPTKRGAEPQGVRDIEVYVNHKWKWSGSLPQSDKSTKIHLRPKNKNNDDVVQEDESLSKVVSPLSPCWLDADPKPTFSPPLLDRNSAPIDFKDTVPKRTARKSRDFSIVNTNSPQEFNGEAKANAELQASWDSLDFLSKTQNRSRLDAKSTITTSTMLDIITDEEVEEMDEFDKYRDLEGSNSTNAELLMEILKSPSHATQKNVIPRQFCEIPILPSGSTLCFELLSTWGDPYYIGLNGIDMYNENGEIISLKNPMTQIDAEPQDINVLDEYNDDPRHIQNLMDGNNYTCDDLHVWLAPYTQGGEHSISVTLDNEVRLSMLRIWNYNKSRTHSYRGVRQIRISMNERIIFQGEIRKAPGALVGLEEASEIILFTTDSLILELIESTDAIYGNTQGVVPTDETSSVVFKALEELEAHRPTTGDADEKSGGDRLVRPNRADQSHASYEEMHHGMDLTQRPGTAATRPKEIRRNSRKVLLESVVEKAKVTVRTNASPMWPKCSASELHCGKHMSILLTSTWGDQQYVGLTGIEVLVGEEGNGLVLPPDHINASPRDLHTLGSTGDPRTIDKLVDGFNETQDDTHMWLIPFVAGNRHEISLNLGKEQLLYGLRIWNYNKSHEDAHRGVKSISVYLDGHCVGADIAVRKASGNVILNAVQCISLSKSSLYPTLRPPLRINYVRPALTQDYEAPIHPQGFVLKFVLNSTWGDPYYIGLNGIQIFDFNNQEIDEKPQQIVAIPYSIEDYSSEKADARVPENLLNGENNTWDATCSWLAPLLQTSVDGGRVNVVYLVYNKPITVSRIQIWNYSKTPSRGVRDFEIWMDDLLIYCGSLRKAPELPGRRRDGRELQMHDDFGQPIVFSVDESVILKTKSKILYCGNNTQHVMCIDERQLKEGPPMTESEIPPVDVNDRPSTAVYRR